MAKINVYDLISKCLGADKSQLSDDTSYQSIPQWDSFRHVSLMVALEKAYGIRINEKDILKLTSINAIEKFIHSHKKVDSATISNGKVAHKKKIHRGLDGVFFDNTTITSIDGDKGNLLYRGYAIEELVQISTFDEVSYLLIFGKLPSSNEFERYKNNLSSKKSLSDATIDYIAKFSHLSFDAMLKIYLSAFSSLETQDKSLDRVEIGLNLIAKLPLVIMHQKLLREGQVISAFNPNASIAENFLSLLHGGTASEEDIKILDQVMILHADHGSNASSFVARITTSTEADMYSAITAAICAFSGSLHGGALERVMAMLNEINTPENAAEYIRHKIDTGSPIYGYGHRVYKTQDPRAKALRELAHQISLRYGNTKYFDILESINVEMKSHTKYGLNVNVDFYVSVIYHFLKIPQEMFLAVFIMSRIPGWTAQVLEQKLNNILIRPRLNYIGGKEKKYILPNNR